MFLNSAGNTEARPTDVLQPYNSADKDTLLWLGELENTGPHGEGNSLGDLQIHTTDDNVIIEEQETLEKSSKSNVRGTGIEAEASAVGEASGKETQVSRTARNAACIVRHVYQTIYNYGFRIPVCKQGCKHQYKTVNFPNGKTLAIPYNCYI